MLRRSLVSAAVALAVAFGALTVPAATDAGAVTKPVLSFQTKARTVTTPCGDYAFKVTVPVLAGSTAANRAAVADWAGFLTEELSAIVADPRVCKGYLNGSSTIKTVAEGGLYQGRYVSVMARWRSDGQGNLRTLNLDLRTGKTVGPSRFAANPGKVRTWASCGAFVAIAAWLRKAFCPGGEYEQPLVGWRVASDGVYLYGRGDDGNFYAPVLSWAQVLKPSYGKAAKRTTKNVRALPGECKAAAEKSTVTVQGQLVTATRAATKTRPKLVYYGLRSAGSAAGTQWAVKVALPDLGPDAAGGSGLVYFATKSSRKALNFSFSATCPD